MNRISRAFLCMALLAAVGLAGCTPHVEVGLPDRPIEINITAKIDHDVRVRVEKDVQNLVQAEKELF